MNAVIERGSVLGYGQGTVGARPRGRAVRGYGGQEHSPHRVGHRGRDRSQAWRRPAGRPAAVEPRSVHIGAGPHGNARRRAYAYSGPVVGRGGVMSVVAVVVVLAAVILLAAQVRSIGAATVPGAVGTVEVSAGESLSTIAADIAPDSPTHQVIDRIMELNDLDGAGLHVGQSLVVPQEQDG